MLQATYKSSPYVFYVSTEDNRIDTTVTTAQIRYLFKLTNDMSKAVKYGYGQNQTVYDRYTKMELKHKAVGAENVYNGEVDLVPNGYWQYEIYEVSWQESPTLTVSTAPATETQVLTPPASTKGVVKGMVNSGKLYVTEENGQEQVQYNQYVEPAADNYIYYGQ
tara:strand:- start:6 stop:497 length:492 start_codon:yes stop_codon:yes gene_type:complete